VFSITGPATQNLGLPGQWFQLETGLNYNWHRHCDASLARYTSPDPLGFVDGPALYAYAGGAPHLVVDENGLNRAPRRPLSAPTNFTPRTPTPISSGGGGPLIGQTGTVGTAPNYCTGGVYALRDPVTGKIMYIGRTIDFARRQSEHRRDPRFEGLQFQDLYMTNNPFAQRGLEQSVYERLNPSLNRINPVSPSNPNRQNYFNAANPFLGR
jgi:RHS repeat-associated protein